MFAIGRTSGYNCKSGVGQEICNLPWAIHNYYMQYRYSMDDAMLRDRVYPRLKRSINYYLHLLKEGDVLAHPFTRHPGGFVNREGQVHEVIKAARLRISISVLLVADAFERVGRQHVGTIDHAIRVRDQNAPLRKNFSGLKWYPAFFLAAERWIG